MDTIVKKWGWEVAVLGALWIVESALNIVEIVHGWL